VVFEMHDGHRIVYNDARRFGIMDIIVNGSPRRIRCSRHLGVEPLGNSFDAWHLWRAFRGKRAPLKAALLDQRIIAGLGNIYVCEALHRARLSPLRLAGTLARRRAPTSVSSAWCGNPRRPDRGHRGRRLDLARLCPHRRQRRRLPDGLRGLRPRGRALPAARLPRAHPPHRAGRPLDLLVPGVPAMRRQGLPSRPAGLYSQGPQQ
jgi:hypothetical protein